MLRMLISKVVWCLIGTVFLKRKEMKILHKSVEIFLAKLLKRNVRMISKSDTKIS